MNEIPKTKKRYILGGLLEGPMTEAQLFRYCRQAYGKTSYRYYGHVLQLVNEGLISRQEWRDALFEITEDGFGWLETEG